MIVPLLDLDAAYQQQRAELDAAIQQVVASQHFIGGPHVVGIENDIAAYLGGDVHAVACGSGSDAIILALRALDIGPGDHVITPVHSFTSTATSVDIVGAQPLFADVLDDTLNIDPQSVAKVLTEQTRAVIAVHLFGLPADIPAIRAVLDAAGRADVAIIEDCAQGLGALWGGRPACTMGDLATISFFPTKNLGAYGDGGMVIAKKPEHAQQLTTLRSHGARTKYKAEIIGYNSRLDALQAAILRVKLPALDGWCEARRSNAARYRALFAEANIAQVRLPADDGPVDGTKHIYNQFNLRVQDRDALAAHLKANNVGSAVYYPRTLAQQPCYADRGFRDADFPVATQAAADSLAIPIFPEVGEARMTYVVETIAAFYQ